MTTTEKLNAIKSKCEKLLALAEKRTPGKWKTEQENREIGTTGEYETETFVAATCETLITNGWNLDSEEAANFGFIAACAGNAEAGWRSTIAAIDGIIPLAFSVTDYILAEKAQKTASAIIAAWEGLV